jgi:prepilin-type N-terminal cleavage/methylation domain-containing protein
MTTAARVDAPTVWQRGDSLMKTLLQDSYTRLPKRDRRGGFTVIEMLVVILTIGILAALLGPGQNRARGPRRTPSTHGGDE